MERKAGCLIIHGFGGNIEEVLPLAEKMNQAGYHVVTPALRGHTGRKKDLRGVHHMDWICDCEEIYAQMALECNEVHLMGFSMGGLISIHLNAKYEADSLSLINTPIYYWNISRILLNILDDIRGHKSDFIRHYLKAAGLSTFSSLMHFLILLNKTKSIVREIKNPVLVVQSLDDDTVRIKSADFIFDGAISNNKRKKLFDKGGHLILKSPAASQVTEVVLEFVKENGKH